MILFFGAIVISVNSCVHAPYVLPVNQRTNDPNICFEQDILPIFISNCAKSGCHDATSHVGGYVLDNYIDIIRKGIVPGNYAASKIYESVAWSTGESKMPIGIPSLNITQLDLLKRWIVAGAVDSGACNNICDTANFTYSGAISPLIQKYCVGCHNSTSSAGGSLADYNSVKTAAVSGRLIGDISHQAGYNAMPLGLQLSDCQVTQVKKWVAAGALNN
ncbi:MAG: c-type cytochrome domain-containing protein [Chitinophagales bacterium]